MKNRVYSIVVGASLLTSTLPAAAQFYGNGHHREAYRREREARVSAAGQGVLDAINPDAYDRGFNDGQKRGEHVALYRSRMGAFDRGYKDFLDWRSSTPFESRIEIQQPREALEAAPSPASTALVMDGVQPFYRYDDFEYPREDSYYGTNFSSGDAYSIARTRKMRELYRDGYFVGFGLKFREVVQNNQESEYERGRAQAEYDLTKNPVRLLDVQVEGDIENGVFRTGDMIELRIDVANLGDEAVSGEDISFEIKLPNTAGVRMLSTREGLSGTIGGRTAAVVRNALALEVRPANDSQNIGFFLSVKYRGREMASRYISVARD